MKLLNFIKDITLKQYSLTVSQFIILSSVFIAAFYNNHLWGALFNVVDTSKIQHLLFLFAVLGLLFTILNFLFSLASMRQIIKPVVSLFFVLSAVTAYYMDNFGIIFDVNMIQNILETNYSESTELLDSGFFIHIFIYGLIPVLLITRVQIRKQPLLKEIGSRAIIIITPAIMGLLLTYTTYKEFTFIFRENPQIRDMVNPSYPVLSAYKYMAKQIKQTREGIDPVFSDAHRNKQAIENNKTLFIMVIGETARAQNFHLNGYARNTTPNLEKENILNFKNINSCGTATAVSLPCIFSHLNHDNYDGITAENSDNLLDALKTSGISVLWRDNNSGCKGVCARVATQNLSNLHIDILCNTEECFDEILLHNLNKQINNLQTDTVIVLHQQGSHGPNYYKRHPQRFSTFMPECHSASVQNCSQEEIINAYDNTILYTDYFLSKVITYLKQKSDQFDTAMLYVSDHGESLGENGIYLHGLPYFMAPEYQTHVPMVMWLSDKFVESKHIDRLCLGHKENDQLSHDLVVHSLLGIMDVTTHLYEQNNDIFSSCRGIV